MLCYCKNEVTSNKLSCFLTVMKAEESKTKGTHAARSFGMVACWKGKERMGSEKQSLKTGQQCDAPEPLCRA